MTNQKSVSKCLNKVISNGSIISNELKNINGRKGFERIYYFDKKYYFTENPKLYSNAQLQFFYDIAKQNGIKNLIIE